MEEEEEEEEEILKKKRKPFRETDFLKVKQNGDSFFLSESTSCKKGVITKVWRDILSSKGKKAGIHKPYSSRSRRFMPNSNIAAVKMLQELLPTSQENAAAGWKCIGKENYKSNSSEFHLVVSGRELASGSCRALGVIYIARKVIRR